VIQIFNVAERKKLKNVDISEPILFWKWATKDKLAIVTQNALYYIDLSKPGDSYSKVMDRFDALRDPNT
jgi:hypothetical protein